jgi:hypothetical protein
MFIKTQTYTLPEHWAGALVNDDYTGLSDDEESELTQWLDDNTPGHCIEVSDNPEFNNWHDAIDYALPCNCLTYTFQHASNY